MIRRSIEDDVPDSPDLVAVDVNKSNEGLWMVKRGTVPSIEVEAFTNEQERLFSRKECLSCTWNVLICGIPKQKSLEQKKEAMSNDLLRKHSEAQTGLFSKVIMDADKVKWRRDENNCVGALHSRFEHFGEELGGRSTEFTSRASKLTWVVK